MAAASLVCVLSVSAQEDNIDIEEVYVNDPRWQDGRIIRAGARARSKRSD